MKAISYKTLPMSRKWDKLIDIIKEKANLKNNKTEEEKRLISLKQSLGSLKRYNYEEYKKRLDLIRTIEPDYDPNETPKQRFKKKCELLKKK